MNTKASHNAWLYAGYTYHQEREWKALRERLRREQHANARVLK